MKHGILDIQNLSFSYMEGMPSAVKGVSFEILPRTATAILGPNGAGKTTLLHLLLGIKKPLSGTISLNRTPLHQYSRRSLSQWIGLVPQSENLAFEYSVLEYVLLGRAPYLSPLEQPSDKDIAIAEQALQEVGIESLIQRSVLALSGGEQQLVTLARALAQKPKILLLDEPTSHLDLANRNITLRIMDRLRHNGTTVIFTTHDPEAAALIADYLVLMRSGEVLDAGTMEATFTSSKLSQTYGAPVEVVHTDGLWFVKSMERLACPPQLEVS
ncbi:MAG: ABC transporter ATP-binding protein [Anaerolineaceae bacterium]|nr:ABC transporter ATP-binding protein [Anaerolineaceae bacterium]